MKQRWSHSFFCHMHMFVFQKLARSCRRGHTRGQEATAPTSSCPKIGLEITRIFKVQNSNAVKFHDLHLNFIWFSSKIPSSGYVRPCRPAEARPLYPMVCRIHPRKNTFSAFLTSVPNKFVSQSLIPNPDPYTLTRIILFVKLQKKRHHHTTYMIMRIDLY